MLYLDRRGTELAPGACGVVPVGVPHAWRGERPVDRDGRAAPACRRKRHLLPRPGARRRSGRARRPRSAQPEPLPAHRGRDGRSSGSKAGAAVGAPTVSASMATAVLALQRNRGEDARRPAARRPAAHDVHGRLPAGSGRAPARPPVRGVVLHARRRGGRRRERRPVHAPAGRRLLDGDRVRARVLRDARGPGAVARDVGARPAAAPLVPLRAGLGLPRESASQPMRASARREPRERQAGGAPPRRPRAVRTPLPADAADPRLRGPRPVALPQGRGVRHDAPLLGPGGGRDRRREPARGARPRGGDVSGPRPRPRARRRPAAAARRDARTRVRHQRRTRRLDERELAGRPADRLVRDRRREHRCGDGGGARARAHDRRRRGRVLRRRGHEPGLRVSSASTSPRC